MFRWCILFGRLLDAFYRTISTSNDKTNNYRIEKGEYKSTISVSEKINQMKKKKIDTQMVLERDRDKYLQNQNVMPIVQDGGGGRHFSTI